MIEAESGIYPISHPPYDRHMRRILVTSALPYANGPIHLGHLLEYIQSDIWVRWQRLFGNTCHYVCADDAHGSAVMLSAEKNHQSVETWIDQIRCEHERDLRAFGVNFDVYHSTHSPETQRFAEVIYSKLRDRGHIFTREIEQLFDPQCKMFLSDRFIKGACPRCKSSEQYGDNCEVCGATYEPDALINPRSTLSGATPVRKRSLHLFFALEHFQTLLANWIERDSLQPEVRNKLREWFAEGLQAWDISRDEPYFGFKIPGYLDKYFYVWLDAPIGYPGAFQYLCNLRGNIDFDAFWRNDDGTELYHFIGKDIIYFHGLFWPAMLSGAGWRVPSGIFAHGFVTVNHEKMSKSRGTFILARDYLRYLDPQYLRYYFAAKLSSGIDDIDFSSDDFMERNNADLVGKLVNIASRCARFINRDFEHRLASALDETQTARIGHCVVLGESIAKAYEARDYAQVVRLTMAEATATNRYIDQCQPWVLAKKNPSAPEIQRICTAGLNLFRLMILYLSPILPAMAEQVRVFLCMERWCWQERDVCLLNQTIALFSPLITRIDRHTVQALMG